MNMELKKIELTVPADRNMMLIIRMTTSGVMSRVGFTLDEMDDMKMAVDEACNLMLLQKPGCDMLYIWYTYDDTAVSVHVEGRDIQEATDGEKPDANMQEVICCILESIVDEVSITPRKDGSTESVCLKKYIPNTRRSAV